MFLVRNSFLAMQRNWCSLDWLSANSSVLYAFQPPVRKLPKMFLKKAKPRRHCRPREKGARGRDLPPNFLLLFAYMRSSEPLAFRTMCSDIPAVMSAQGPQQKDNKYDRILDTKENEGFLFRQHISSVQCEKEQSGTDHVST